MFVMNTLDLELRFIYSMIVIYFTVCVWWSRACLSTLPTFECDLQANRTLQWDLEAFEHLHFLLVSMSRGVTDYSAMSGVPIFVSVPGIY